MASQPTWNDPVAHLRAALSADAFDLYCQPIAALGGLVMAYPMGEILIRMREEEQAMLPPGEFLPILEHYGLMPHLDRWVLRKVLKHLAVGIRIARLCLNTSAQTVADPSFPLFIADQLSAVRVPGNCLLFEIDEADAMAVPDSAARFAAFVASLGAGIVLDGFGRSADAVQLFEFVPCVRAVKLHGSFTRQLLVTGEASPLLAMILREAKRRGIMVVAECVEDPKSLPQLKALGIRYVQGFGVYKPQPFESFTEAHVMAAI